VSKSYTKTTFFAVAKTYIYICITFIYVYHTRRITCTRTIIPTQSYTLNVVYSRDNAMIVYWNSRILSDTLLRDYFSTVLSLTVPPSRAQHAGRSRFVRFDSRISFLCWLLFRYPFHPRVTAVAHKRPQSFCHKCRRQVTAKHTYTLRMWLCMK